MRLLKLAALSALAIAAYGQSEALIPTTNPGVTGNNCQSWQTQNYVLTTNSHHLNRPLQTRPDSESKRILILGSSTARGLGSSTCSVTSWAAMFKLAMEAKGYTVFNVSHEGDNSTALIGRFYTDVAPFHPDFVVLAGSIFNDGGPTAGNLNFHMQSLHRLLKMVEGIGAIPVLAGQFPNNSYSVAQYQTEQDLYTYAEKLGVQVWDFMSGTVDVTTGHYNSGITSADGTHPDDAGHLAMYQAIPQGYFDVARSVRATPFTSGNQSWQWGGDTTNIPLKVAAFPSPFSFTLAAWIKDAGGLGSAFMSSDRDSTNPLRVRSNSSTGVCELVDGGTTIAASTVSCSGQAWHHHAISYNSLLNRASYYIDGVLIGSPTALTRSNFQTFNFTFLGRFDSTSGNCVGCQLAEPAVYRVPLQAQDIVAIYNGQVLRKSLEFYSKLNNTPGGSYAVNLADTGTQGTLGSTTSWSLTGTFSASAVLSSRLQSVNVKDFGAKGDGVTDDSVAFQAAVTAAAGGVLDGGGSLYLVQNISVPSNSTLRNFRLKVKAGSTFPVTGLTVDGRSSAKTNITIKDVTIDGNRVNMAGFDVNTGNDGDKSCVKLWGQTSNVFIEHLTANYCGTDGLQIVSSSPASDNDSDLQFHDITVKDSIFKYNRRQGISADSTVNFLVSNVVAEYNGLDMVLIQGLTGTNSNADLVDWQSGSYTATATCGASFAASVLHGDCGGRTIGGSPYASGIDMEGYGVGSANHNLSILNSKLVYNAKGGLLSTDQANPATTGFVARRGYHIIGNTLDVGYYNGTLGPFPWAMYITAGFAAEYQEVEVIGNVILSGTVGIFDITGGTVVGNRINTNGLAAFWMNTGSCPNLRVASNSSDQVAISYFDTAGSIFQESFPRTAANATLSTASNYTAMFGSFNTPLGIGSFSDKDVIASFGTPLYINPNAQTTVFPSLTTFTGQALFGSSAVTGQTGSIGVGGSLNLQSDTNGSLIIGRFSSGNPNSLINAQNADASAPSSISFAFAGTTKAKVNSDGSFTSNSSAGGTAVVNVRNSTNGGACTITYAGGLFISTTCP